ncbi:trypsin eta isoform X1 [Drosophila mojavensis]|uniref:Uncharacterized protein, isoform A n=2 Tax=Drosophila mojavensis TaxID=7230 RepID=B4KCZ0_DROMO|nr:trypsin eta isoform X1 [Drosophila mojavensis]EDW13760.1 uncharacterized protein Dmoj_GI23884, isoform A [Drosophila mojavensis]
MFVSQALPIGLLLLAAGVAAAATEHDDQQRGRTVETHAKIVGGYPITIADAPYIVSIRARYYHEASFGEGHMCGGSVISQRVVCSAAHCFEINDTMPVRFRDSENFVVVAGVTYLDERTEFTAEYLVEKIIGHHNYIRSTLENDIALLFLNGIIPNDSLYIRPVSLAEHPFSPGTLCAISGWGNQKMQLMQAIIPTVHEGLCSFIYMYLPRSQLCAGWMSGGIDACRGDSGGPLVCMNSLTGIISWGVDCGRRFFPGVYTNISYFIPWIKMVNATFNYNEFKPMRRSLRNNNNCSFRNLDYLRNALLLTIIILAT